MKKIITLCLIFCGIALAQAQNKFPSNSFAKHSKGVPKSAKSNSASTYDFNLCDSSYYFTLDTANMTWYPETKDINTYNSKNQLVSRTNYQILNSNWVYRYDDSFFYNSHGKLDYTINHQWDFNNSKKIKGFKMLYYYDFLDSVIKIEEFWQDTTNGFNTLCPTQFGYYYYDSNHRTIGFIDSAEYPLGGLVCTYDFSGRDSISYYSNGLMKEYYTLNAANHFVDFRDVKRFINYSPSNFVNFSIYLMWDSLILNWDTFSLEQYKYYANRIEYIDSTWDFTNHSWIATGGTYISYLPSHDRYKNKLFDKNEYLYNSQIYQSDSTHYYYHIPSCLSYYTTDYDTLTNSFNLTLDSITNTQAVAYHWNFGDGSTSNLQYPSHTYLVDTTYNVCLTIYKSNGDSCTYCHIIGKDYQGHIIKSAGFNLNVKGQGNIGVNEIVNERPELVVYPNPCKDKLLVTSYQSLVNTILITDVVGRNCISIINHKSDSDNIRNINIENLPTGVYFLKATDEKGNSYNAKFVKQ